VAVHDGAGWRLPPEAARTYRVSGDNHLGPRQNSISQNAQAGTAAIDAERWQLLVSQLTRGAESDPDKTRPRRVVILTHTAGVPGWDDAYGALADALELTIPPDRSPADVVRQHLSGNSPSSSDSFWRVYSAIHPEEPPPGYRHLANLVAKGCIDLVITTSWDPLLEIAFSKIFQPSQYRILIRGEFDDAVFAHALLERGIPQIVKLNGDLRSDLITCTSHEWRSFGTTPGIVSALRKVLAGSVVITDLSGRRTLEADVSLLRTLAAGASFSYAVGKTGAGTYSNWLSSHARTTNNVVSDLDAFMIELDRDVELRKRRHARSEGQELQDEMIRALQLSAASISSEDVAHCVEELVGFLNNAGIEWIAYVEDSLAPGGKEMRRLLASTPMGRMPYLRVSVTGENGNRIVNRRAVVEPEASVPAGSRIAVVDSVAFSGNTLRMAIEALVSRFTEIDVIPAVLVASQSLIDGSHDGGRWWLDRLVYSRITRRHAIAFPWGTDSLTDTVTHKFGYGSFPRSVATFQRPWGSAEVFATSESCSVRVLSIQAGQGISLHRHLCRDELFVALDSAVALDISSSEFESDITGEFDSRVRSVTLEAGEHLLIPRGIWHRFRAPTARIRVLEVAFGVYDEEFDIERLLDLYGRADRLASATTLD
jgi:mannose-6-phosphate isomerase